MVEENNLGKLFARIAKISGELGALQKDAKNTQQGYNYFSADAVMGHINSLMKENGLVIIPTVKDVTPIESKEGIQRYLIHYEMLIGDVDGNMLAVNWSGESPMQLRKSSGEGLITDDKSMGKAHTYSHKYFLIHLFKISTVDTDDLDKSDNAPVERGKSQSPAKQKTEKKSTDPDEHFGKKDANAPIFYKTKPITELEVKQKDSNSKPYIVAANLTLFSREPFRKLNYDKALIDDLAKVGKHSLLEGEAFEIVWHKEGNNKKLDKMIHIATGNEVTIE